MQFSGLIMDKTTGLHMTSKGQKQKKSPRKQVMLIKKNTKDALGKTHNVSQRETQCTTVNWQREGSTQT